MTSFFIFPICTIFQYSGVNKVLRDYKDVPKLLPNGHHELCVMPKEILRKSDKSKKNFFKCTQHFEVQYQ